MEHASHCPLHAVSQHMPSAQFALAHDDAPLGHCCPFFSLHAPDGSQVLVVGGQLSGSSAPMTAVHAPLPGVHVMHVPLHAPEQHVPSSHTFERHSAFDVQVPPAATCPTHLPVPSQ
jgi:hypothetical protein